MYPQVQTTQGVQRGGAEQQDVWTFNGQKLLIQEKEASPFSHLSLTCT